MRIGLLCLAIITFCIINHSSVFGNTCEFETLKSVHIKSNSIFLVKHPDTLVVTIKIKAILPIGWGNKYKCKVLGISKGELADSCFLMSTENGSEKKIKEIQYLRAGENYIVEFVKNTEDKTQTFIPVGTTGFLDKNGIIWSISKINKTSTENESTFALLAF